MTDPLDNWPAFVARVRERLEAGRRAYGDASFSADPATLIGELQQECRDLAGWGFVLNERLERAREALGGATAEVTAPSVPVLAGIDLSLQATGVVVAPASWDGAWARVRSTVIGEPLRKNATVAERARRTESIAARLVEFCRAHGVTQAWIESPAFGMKTAQHSLGELHGVCKLALIVAGIDVQIAQVSSARKLLLGKVPKQDPKGAVQAALIAAGAPASWSADELDAMCVLNWAMSEAGGWCLAQEAA